MPPQVVWLEEDLAATDRKWKVVFFHKPLFVGDRARPGSREVLQPIFVSAGVDLVFSGHEHYYERFHPVDGVTHFITGGGMPLYEPGPPTPDRAYAESVQHFMLCRADAETVSIEAIDRSGHVFDAIVVGK